MRELEENQDAVMRELECERMRVRELIWVENKYQGLTS